MNAAPSLFTSVQDRAAQVAMLLLFAMPPLAVVVPLSLAPLLALLFVAALVWHWPIKTDPWRRLKPVLATLGLVVAYALISVVWSLEALPTLKNALVLGVSCLGGLFVAAMMAGLPDRQADRLLSGFLWSCLLTLTFCLFVVVFPAVALATINTLRPETFPPGTVIEKWISRGVIVILLAAPALLLASWRRNWRIRSAILATLLILVSLLGISLATMLALAAVIGVSLVVWRFQRPAVLGLAALMTLWTLGSLVLFASLPTGQVMWQELRGKIPFSSHHRLVIWRFSAEMALHKPLLGWGFDAARRIPGGEDKIVIVGGIGADGQEFVVGEQLMPLHPHSAAMQWWLELGFAGVSLMLAFILALMRHVVRSVPDRLSQAVAFGGIAAVFAVANVSFGFWQNWWLASLWLIAGLYGISLKHRD